VAVNVTVYPRRNETAERLIRRFTKKVKKERILETYREKTDHYIKPAVKRKIKHKKAIREQQRAQRKQDKKLFR
jgi:ribosomal protein S21